MNVVAASPCQDARAGGTARHAWFRPADQLAAKFICAALLFFVLVDYGWMLREPSGRDFISFWGAGAVAIQGQAASAYDYAVLHAVQLSAAPFTGELPFPYPPIFLLLVAPLALLPYPVALGAWVVLTFVGYLLAVRRLLPSLGWLAAAYPPTLANVLIGQAAFVTAGIFAFGLSLLRKRPFAAGLVLGCLIVKPQLGVLLPVALIAGGHWRAVAGAALSSVGALLVGVALFGVATSEAWLMQMPYYVEIARTGTVGWHKFISVNAALRQAGAGAEIASAIHALVALAAAVAVWRVWRWSADWEAKAAILVAGTLLISPYAYIYDALILIVAFKWLGRNCSAPLFWLLWCLPGVTIFQIATSPGLVGLGPVAPLTVTLLVWGSVELARRRRGSAYEPGRAMIEIWRP